MEGIESLLGIYFEVLGNYLGESIFYWANGEGSEILPGIYLFELDDDIG